MGSRLVTTDDVFGGPDDKGYARTVPISCKGQLIFFTSTSYYQVRDIILVPLSMLEAALKTSGKTALAL